MIKWNKNDYDKWVQSGCTKNGDIKILDCSWNKLSYLTEIRNLTNLTKLSQKV